MEKIIKPTKWDEDKYIFTEEINYFETGKESIWGKGDKETLKLLDKEEIKGKWLNLAAGDGRYNLQLLKKADLVVALDIDASALSKLYYYTPKEYKFKLKTKVYDIIKKFPFEDNSFDGILCTGVLHLFPRKIFRKISSEINRILKPGGKLIIDFATDIKRTYDNNKIHIVKGEPLYTFNEAIKELKNIFKNYSIKINKGKINEYIKNARPPYTLKGNFVLMKAVKNGK